MWDRTEDMLSFLQVQSESFVQNDTVGLQKNEILVPLQDQQLRKESPSQSQQGQLSSPATHSSLQDVWQILEMGSDPSVLSPQSNNEQGKYDMEIGDDLILLSESQYSSYTTCYFQYALKYPFPTREVINHVSDPCLLLSN